MTDTKRWETFKSNVNRWADVRGIYEQSTEVAQQVKGLEEVGEYLMAKTDEERMDAVGDIAVCIINAAAFRPYRELGYWSNMDMPIGRLTNEILRGCYNTALSILKAIAEKRGYDFLECCEGAWEEIKDRKGLMVDGFYVKWENLTEEQQEEFRQRDINNTLIRGR